MKNKELFEKTVNILVNAYQKNTLQHGQCSACAVGNIVAHNMGYVFYEIFPVWVKGSPYWADVFITALGGQTIYPEKYIDESKKQIDSTGYTWQELAKIEYAFEMSSKGNNNDDWMFNGLLAVYDVLCKIHEVSKDEVTKGELVFIK